MCATVHAAGRIWKAARGGGRNPGALLTIKVRCDSAFGASLSLISSSLQEEAVSREIGI